ncbi:C2 domain protein [Aspergillus clavatus NRRL 1]|uniref:C2 domain protein n=1 Tax=Aspergillus clavatus (strain ATCC 1007 / CBS 513.65 / DSM 816 / NCTC 3887 / NRRL 1 / QM 1276 / 107) TaxID=344612 RepID=A1CI43_ASPCL|nr:C2 domain protein [Aspergillus clavatus NRRL 1]EAW10548.1 C2 domain protein [Aspergillus clavatus NRRL 1]
MPPHPNNKETDSPQQHRMGEHWSGANPVPTISKFMERLDQEKQQQAAYEKAMTARERQAQGGPVAHQPRKKPKGKTRVVTDPITGRDMEVEDQDGQSMEAVKDPKLVVPNANLGKPTDIKTDAHQNLSDYKENQDITAPPDPIAAGTTSDVPIHGEKTNILFHPTPTVSYKPMFDELEKRASAVCVGILLGVIFLGRLFGGSLWGLAPLAICTSAGVWLWMKEVIRSGREMEWSSEQLRGQTATANLLPESVEWMNTFLGLVWNLANPEMLAPVADTIEDIMQASAPGVVENVRIAEIDQGNNPLRILSMRALPDEHVQQLKDNIREENMKNKDPQEAAAAEEGGSYYNLEASFAYHAKPSGQSASSKARNMHMQIMFYLGIQGLFGVPFPVFVELIELVGTVRLRLQMMPEAPFLKEVTYSLVGIPHVRAGCMPMVKSGVNILNLPLISNFVNYAIGTACSLFAAPKSMTMDLSMLLKGDDILKETQAIGIMWVRIHRAIGLSKQDKRGSYGGGSDPYINLSFSKYGKPMYCTRVITDDLNPVWEETAALLVTPELIKADENLSVELWDSDRNTADDIVGKVELPIREMLQHPGRMYPQVSKLQGLNEGTEMPGELHWEVGFFGKPKLRPELRTDGKKKDLPENLQDIPEFQDEKGTIITEEEDAVTHTPPDPLWPSGILSIVVHQIVNLQLANINGSNGNRKGREYEPAKSYGENTEEQGKELPTSYCKILLNDELVYRTRAKAVSSKPIFNAGTERFVRDWRSAMVTVTVRDQRYREHDPILGVVQLKLSNLFEKSSQVTRWYPLDGGIGFGRIRISLLLRHVETSLPPNMLGWDVGTFHFASDKITLQGYNHRAKIRLRTGGSSGKIPRRLCHVEGNSSYFDLSDESFRRSIRLPVKHRYRSPVVFELHTQGKHSAAGYAILWLQHLVDNEDTVIDLPIWSTKNGERLTQNYITEGNWKAKERPGLEDLHEIGRLQLRGVFTPGIDDSHEQYVVDSNSRETFETWEACMAEGVRPHRITAEIPEDLEKLHEESLRAGRDVLKQSHPRERKRWIDKQGHDWSGAFGDDPAAYLDSKGRKIAEPGRDQPAYDPVNPPQTEVEQSGAAHLSISEESSVDSDKEHLPPQPQPQPQSQLQQSSQQPPQQRLSDPQSLTDSTSTQYSEAGSSVTSSKRAAKRSEQRQQRGMMQWKPARNAVFARDEAKFALRKVKHKFTGSLSGREPDIETETGQ